MNEALQLSREIMRQAISEYQPYAIVAMMSGGKDSRCAYEVAKLLGIKIDFICHGRTRTGVFETTQHVREFAASEGVPYFEADAGDAYEQYVLRKGFYGVGQTAHEYTYHTLKAQPFRKAISKHIRQGQRGRNILLLNGARIEESDNRRRNMATPFNRDPAAKSNIWVNICHHWTQPERNAFLSECKKPLNPVTQLICRSGECMCGSMQSKEDRAEVGFFFPDWKRWLDDLERRVMQQYPWGWGEPMTPSLVAEAAGQIPFADFQPMCVGCVRNAPQLAIK